MLSRRTFLKSGLLLPLMPELLVRVASGQEAQWLEAVLPQKLEAIRQKYNVPAMFVAIGYGEKVGAAYCSGQRKIGLDSPVQLSDRVMIGSISKSCCCFVAANLIAKGMLQMDTTIAEVLTDLRDTMHPAYRNATVVQLLTHKAGIPDGGIANGIPWGLKAPAQEYRYTWVRNLLKAPPAAPAGQYYYGSGHEVMAAMCERVTNQTYESLLLQYVFQPCGMKSAILGRRPYDDGTAMGRTDQPWGHVVEGGKIKPFPLASNTYIFCSASGGINCTINDLCLYGNAMALGYQERETPLGTEAFRILCQGIGWGGGWGGDGMACGDFSSLRVTPDHLVIAVHSTLGVTEPNTEIISFILDEFRAAK